MTQQGTLLAIRVKAVVPSPFQSADMHHLAIGADGQDYALKSPLANYPEHAAAEALSYKFAAACGLAVPMAARLILPDGSEAFGSRFEGGISQFSQLTLPDRLDVVRSCAAWISALCTLDAFLANNDRHFDNGLFRRSIVDNRWTFIAMDFSRALWWGGDYPYSTCAGIYGLGNTANTITFLRAYNCWDKATAGTTAASLSSINPATISGWVSELPVSWRTQRVDSLETWWQSEERTNRIAELLSLI